MKTSKLLKNSVKYITGILFILFICDFVNAQNRDISFTQEDKERIIRMEVKIDEMSKRFEEKFEQIDKRLDRMEVRIDHIEVRIDSQFNILLSAMGILLGGMIVLIGFVLYDRRSTIRPLEARVKLIEQLQDDHIKSLTVNQTKLKTLIEALQTLGKKNPELSTILKQFNLI